MNKKYLLVILLILFIVPYGFSQETDEPREEPLPIGESVWPAIGLVDPVLVLGVASVIAIIAMVLAFLVRLHASEKTKKILFLSIAVPIAIATLYVSGATIYLNVVSVTEGPVHWHADYEVWACGENYELVKPKGLEGRVGPIVLHEHGDNRLHVEGLLLDLRQASLGSFFSAVGGSFSKEELIFPTDEGVNAWRNGDLCNGQPAKWHLFVNSEQNNEFGDYILSPHTSVPPGDEIKLVFTEKPLNEINPVLGEEP